MLKSKKHERAATLLNVSGFIRAIVVGIALLTVAASASFAQQDYPNRPLRLIIPFPPGGGTDASARILADGLGNRLGQPVIVESKPGAGSALGVNFVLKAPADGYTLLYATSDGMTLMPAVKSDLPYKVPDDVAFICRAVVSPLVLVVSNKTPANTFEEFVAYAKANPKKVLYGSSGVGTTTHMAAVFIERALGIEMTHVVYKGAAPALTDVIAGQIDMILYPAGTVAPYATAGQVKALIQTGGSRDALFPEVKTLMEFGLRDVELDIWYGIMGPAALPANIQDRLRKAMAEVVNDPAVIERHQKLGLRIYPLFGNEFRKLAVDWLERWKVIAKSARIEGGGNAP